MQRLSSIVSQIAPSKGGLAAAYVPRTPPSRIHVGTNTTSRQSQNPDDVVITLAIRTPLTKARKGGLKDTPLDGMLYKLLVEVNKRSKLDPQLVEDICCGNVRPPANLHERLHI